MEIHWPQDWQPVTDALSSNGYAVLPKLFNQKACRHLRSYYHDSKLFRKKIIMAKHGYGSGEYQYFAYPLPEAVEVVRIQAYAQLLTIANAWQEYLGVGYRFPEQLSAYLNHCHQQGQQRPTPLLLKYLPGDFNCLHQDLYGEEVFPLQMLVLLSQSVEEFSGGEIVITEQRPRMQSRAQVIALEQGDGLIFATHQRPKLGARGYYRVKMRHGVSTVRSGERLTLGIIFHDAK